MDIVYTRQFACIEIKHTTEMGYGVYATRDFEKGELIERCYCIKICDLEKDIPADLKNYAFQYPPGREERTKCYVLPLGYGSIYNHSNNNNANWEKAEEHMFFNFIAVKDINKGEEICTNYGASYLQRYDLNG